MGRLGWSLLALPFLFAACSGSQYSLKEKNGELYYSHGTSELKAKNYTLALKHFLQAEKFIPKDSKLHNNLGMTYFFKGKDLKAIEHLKKSIELDPKNSGARNNLASVYLSRGQLKEAEKTYLKVVDDLIYPFQFRTYHNLGLLELKKHNTRKAREYFKLSIKDKEDHCPAHFQLGMLDKNEGELASAYEHLKQASMGVCVQEEAPHYHQAEILMQQRKFALAEKKLEDFIDRFPKSKFLGLAHRNLAKAKYYVRTGKPSQTLRVERKSPVDSPPF